tara:strand:+ start:448 stop:1053 length:606 start_codon:yes stop_codon:yes gene_type:complete
MHKLNVLILGPSSFISTLNELKSFLKFNLMLEKVNDNYSVILFHVDALEDEKQKQFIENEKTIKICARTKKQIIKNCNNYLDLPATLKEINFLVENTAAKKKFNKNSSLEIKSYLLDKNEKKLSKQEVFIILTEKEVQLLELFLNSGKPISKNKILSIVWKYSADVDTHTVETHIYRLRKKIADKFMDEKFILNNKEGYYL